MRGSKPLFCCCLADRRTTLRGLVVVACLCGLLGSLELRRPASAQSSKNDSKPESNQTADEKPLVKLEGAPPFRPMEVSEPSDIPLASSFESHTKNMREHLKKMRRTVISYHLSESPSEVKRLREDWIRMLGTGRQIYGKMVKEAMEELRKSSDLSSQAALMLMSTSGRNADADRYDGMMEVVELLKEKGYQQPQFDLCYGLTAAANNRYNEALPHLGAAVKNMDVEMQKILDNKEIPQNDKEKIGQKAMETFQLLNSLGDVANNSALWAAEQKAREDDAAGEPLPRVRFFTTKGEFEVELFENDYPNTVANFVSLCEKGFYNKIPFHRVIPHFMAQTGCPNGDGSGGPGYAIRTELNGQRDRNFFRGTLGMAMSALPDSGGSQFFVCFLPRMHLNGKYVAFGRVIEGMDVLSDITRIDPDEKEESEEPKFLDEILSTKVVQKRAHEYKPQTIPEPKPPTAHADHAGH